MAVITTALEERGFRWAYRTVNTLAFGLPQRRRRIIIVGARKSDPRTVLFADDSGERYPRRRAGSPRGFYWTEGRSGLGWARNAVPPLKGGSGLGIPSSPGIWFPDRRFIGTVDIRDAERLQGFRAGWTKPAAGDERSERIRWRLVGNAVSVPVSAWLAQRLLQPGEYDASNDREVESAERWTMAAWGGKGRRYAANVSAWPVRTAHIGLNSFLRYSTVPLSARAAAGFHARAIASSLAFEEGFLDDVAHHIDWMRQEGGVPTAQKLVA